MERVIVGRPLVAASAAGEALVSSEPLSFWGGFDYRTGTIIDARHPLKGECASGRILALPSSKGSSTATAVLLESVRAGTAPAAILCRGADPYFALASIVADEMYGRPIPVVALQDDDFADLRSGEWLIVGGDGRIVIWPRPPRLRRCQG